MFGRVLALFLGAQLLATPAVASEVPVLAGPWSRGQEGYGHSRPPSVFNGGDPTGRIQHIRWTSWGGAQAVGTGTGWYVGPKQIVVEGSYESARIVAFQLGSCHGRRAYDAVEWYFPQHGQHFNPHQYIEACKGEFHS